MRNSVGFVVVCGVVALFACVGSEPNGSVPQPDSGAAAGGDGGGGGGTDATASSSSGGSSSGGSSGSSDSGTDVDADTGVVACPFSSTMDAKIKCAAENCSTPGRCCFLSTFASTCDPSTCDDTILPFGGKAVACDSAQDCAGANPVCCFRTVKAIDKGACPSVVPYADFTETKCAASCTGTNEARTCTSNADCNGGECRKVQLPQISLETGICL